MDFIPFSISEIIKQKRKTVSAHVLPDLSVIIKAPLEASQEEIEAFILRKKLWIQKQIEYFKQFTIQKKKDTFNGSSLLYLGRQYQLLFRNEDSKQSIHMEKSKIILSGLHLTLEDASKLLEEWLLERTVVVFKKELENVMRNFAELPIPLLKIRKLNKRWGSYNKKHEITLNKILIHAPKTAIRYVLTHELCHFYYQEHSKAFYDFLSVKIPNWRKIEKNLESTLLMK